MEDEYKHLTEDHRKRLDEAAVFNQFKNSAFHRILNQILDDYRLGAIREMESNDRSVDNEAMLESVRQLRAANDLKIHIENFIEDKISQVQDVADELGVDLDALRMRSEMHG